jgi:hypothetical protein
LDGSTLCTRTRAPPGRQRGWKCPVCSACMSELLLCAPAGGDDTKARAVASFSAAVLTEIYLCNVCSCHDILRRNGGRLRPRPRPRRPWRRWLVRRPRPRGRRRRRRRRRRPQSLARHLRRSRSRSRSFGWASKRSRPRPSTRCSRAPPLSPQPRPGPWRSSPENARAVKACCLLWIVVISIARQRRRRHRHPPPPHPCGRRSESESPWSQLTIECQGF